MTARPSLRFLAILGAAFVTGLLFAGLWVAADVASRGELPVLHLREAE